LAAAEARATAAGVGAAAVEAGAAVADSEAEGGVAVRLGTGVVPSSLPSMPKGSSARGAGAPFTTGGRK
jgi:hypothetical protein